jgi:hypothetical protein
MYSYEFEKVKCVLRDFKVNNKMSKSFKTQKTVTYVHKQIS